MAIFGFGKKKGKNDLGAPGLPVEQVMALKQQGMDNNQINQELLQQGYNSSQIFDAINQVNMSSSGPIQGQGMEMQQPPPQNFSYDQFRYPEQQYEAPMDEFSMNKSQIEAIAEAIIDEKWKEFEKNVRVIIEWKEKTDIRISKIDQQVKDIVMNLNNLHKSLLGKISDYDKNIMDVGTEIKAMEKVFQKVLPSLTDNVNKLERMTKSSREIKK
jgi:hypothetical protein